MTDQTQAAPRRGRGVRVLLILLIATLVAALGGIAYVLYSVQHTPERTPILAAQPGVSVAFEAFGGSFGQLTAPAAIAYDGNDRIYVTEPQESKVVVFDRGGKNGRIFVQNPPGALQKNNILLATPTGIDVAANGDVYVADPRLSAVVVFDSAGHKLRSMKFTAPSSVTVAGKKLYVLSDRTLFITDLQGNPVAQWGTWGRQQNQLANPGGTAVGPDGTIYMTDRDNYRVLSLTSSLTFRWEFGHTATTEAAANQRVLGGPSGITIGSDGNVYALDGLNSQIIVITKSGRSASTVPLSGPGASDNQLYLPKGIDSMGGDLFVIADTFHNRIVAFHLNPTKP